MNNIYTKSIILITILTVLTVGAVGAVSADSHTEVDVEIEHSTVGTSGQSNDTHTTMSPVIDFNESITITQETTFEIENVDTGESLTVSLADSEDTFSVGDRSSFQLYHMNGTLRDTPRLVTNVDGERVIRNATVVGSDDVFNTPDRDSYRITLLKDDTPVAETGAHPITIEHERQFQYTVDDDEITMRFNAGEIGDESSAFVALRPSDDNSERLTEGTEYDAETNEFVATFDRSEVPDGDTRVSLGVRVSSSGPYTLYLSENATVGESETQPDDGVTVAVVPAADEVIEGSQTTVDIVVSGADSGVSAYNMNVSLDGVGEFTAIDTPQNPQFDLSGISEDQMMVDLQAGMGDNTYDAADEIVLATLTVNTTDIGSIDLAVSDIQISSIGSEQYEIGSPTNTTISVVETPTGPSEPVAGDSLPQDLNGDGLYEDILGSGDFSVFDVQALFSNLDSDVVQNNPEAFNFSGQENPDSVSIFDVQALFSRL